MSIFGELKRRNVFRVGVAYAVTAWLLLQLVDVIAPILEAPDWVQKSILLLLIIGFPLALLFAWAFELTPEGLKFERDVDRGASVTASTGRKLDFVIIGILSIALLFFVVDKFIWRDATTAGPVDERRSIAVLPFTNMSGDHEQQYFSDGVSEEILNTLVRVPGISVASRTSSFAYRGDDLNIADIARELGVLFVLEGSVRKSADNLRITAQLIDGVSDRHLWSETYDRKLAEIFGIQSDIATQISRAIQDELGIETDGAVTIPVRTQNMDAYDVYLRGYDAMAQRITPDDVAEAIEYLERAVELDPEYAEAWEALAAAYSLTPYWLSDDYSLEEGIELAERAAERALAINPKLALAVAVKSARHDLLQPYSVLEQLNLLESATAIDPLHPIPHHWQGHVLLSAGYFEEAANAQRRCLDIDPSNPNCLVFLRFTYVALGRYELARELADAAWQYIRVPFLDANLVSVLLLEGRRQAAIIAAAHAWGLNGAPWEEWIKALENPDGNHTNALRRYIDWAEMNGVELEDFPGILAILGAYDRIDIKRAPDVYFFYWLPMYGGFRASDEFKAMMREHGYYDLWKARGFPPQCRAVGKDDFECD